MDSQNKKNTLPNDHPNSNQPAFEMNSATLKDYKRVILEYDGDIRVKLIFKRRDALKFTCEWLLQEGLNQLQQIAEKKGIKKDFDRVAAFKTKSRNYLVDYYLTMPHKSLAFIKDGTVLVPFFKRKPALLINIDNDETQNKDQDFGVPKASLKDFEIITLLGKGGFSKVYLARKKETGKFFAIKKIVKGDKTRFHEEKEDIYREKYNLTKLKFPFFVQLHYAFQTEKNYFFVLDFIPGGDLRQELLKRTVFTERQAKFYVAEVLAGLQVLHDSKFIHRDLKSANMLLDLDGHVYFSDFGLSKPFKKRNQPHFTMCGTPEYMAPEVITKAGYNVLADYYSLGVLAYEFVVGVPPFQRVFGRKEELFKKVVHQRPVIPSKLSKECRSFLLGLLEKNPNERLGAKRGIKDIIKHPWLADIDFEAITARKVKAPIKIDPSTLIIANVDQQAIDLDQDDLIESQMGADAELKLQGFSYYSASDVGAIEKKKSVVAMLQGQTPRRTPLNKDSPASMDRGQMVDLPHITAQKCVNPVKEKLVFNWDLPELTNASVNAETATNGIQLINKQCVLVMPRPNKRLGTRPKGDFLVPEGDSGNWDYDESTEGVVNESPNIESKIRGYGPNRVHGSNEVAKGN